MLYVCSADSFIRIHPCKLPQGVALDFFRIVLDLCSIGSCLCLTAVLTLAYPHTFSLRSSCVCFCAFAAFMTVTFFTILFSPFPVFSRVFTPCQQHTLPHSFIYIQCYYRYTFASSGEKVLTFKTRIFSHSSSVNSLSSCILFKRNSAILYRTSFAPLSIISPLFPPTI